MSEDKTPYTTANDAPTVSIVASGHLITTTCPHCHQALDLLISDDGRLLHRAARILRQRRTPTASDAAHARPSLRQVAQHTRRNGTLVV